MIILSLFFTYHYQRYTWVPQRLIKEGVRKVYEEDKAAISDLGLESSTISSVEDDQQYSSQVQENGEIDLMDQLQQQSLWSTYDEDDKNDHLSIKPKEMMKKQTEDFKSYLHKQKYRPVDETNDELEEEMNKSMSSSKKKKEKENNHDLPKKSKKPAPPPVDGIVKHDQHWL